MEKSDVEQVGSLVRRWARAFSSNDAETIMALWDEDYRHSLHQAEEFPDPMRGREEIRAYNENMASQAKNFRDPSVTDFLVDVIGDTAWCYLRGDITFDLPELDKPIKGQARQTFLLRRTPAGWRIIHYHESRETPGLRDPLREIHPAPERMQEPYPETYT
jgi:uncharacterized protein (TIGR02246 family)